MGDQLKRIIEEMRMGKEDFELLTGNEIFENTINFSKVDVELLIEKIKNKISSVKFRKNILIYSGRNKRYYLTPDRIIVEENSDVKKNLEQFLFEIYLERGVEGLYDIFENFVKGYKKQVIKEVEKYIDLIMKIC